MWLRDMSSDRFRRQSTSLCRVSSSQFENSSKKMSSSSLAPRSQPLCPPFPCPQLSRWRWDRPSLLQSAGFSYQGSDGDGENNDCLVIPQSTGCSHDREEFSFQIQVHDKGLTTVRNRELSKETENINHLLIFVPQRSCSSTFWQESL